MNTDDDKPVINPNEDVVRRNVRRDLPCDLTQDEFLRIAKDRVQREAEYDELEADLKRDVKKRQDQLKEIEEVIAKMRRELHTGKQDRNMPCNEVFRLHSDGTGWIYVVRLDTFTEVERKPASAAEMHRYRQADLPGVGAGLLDQARTAQAAEVAAEPERAAGGDDVPGDEAVDPVAADEDARRADVGSEASSEDASSDEDAAGASEDARPKKKRRGRS